MDRLQDQILNLQMQEEKIREFPQRLLNCLKFSMEFDKDYPKDAVAKRRNQLTEIRKTLEQFLTQAQDIQDLRGQVIRVTEGNRRFFDQLMAEKDITEAQVREIVGIPPTIHREIRSVTAASSEAGESIPYDEEDVSYELGKENLTEYRRLAQKNAQD